MAEETCRCYFAPHGDLIFSNCAGAERLADHLHGSQHKFAQHITRAVDRLRAEARAELLAAGVPPLETLRLEWRTQNPDSVNVTLWEYVYNRLILYCRPLDQQYTGLIAEAEEADQEIADLRQLLAEQAASARVFDDQQIYEHFRAWLAEQGWVFSSRDMPIASWISQLQLAYEAGYALGHPRPPEPIDPTWEHKPMPPLGTIRETEELPMVKWVSTSTVRAESFDQLTDMLKAAGKLGMGYQVVHDAGNNPRLLGPDGDQGARPSWTVHLLHYYFAPKEEKS